MLALLLTIAAPAAPCVIETRQCRACTTKNGRPRCSTPGIACQPKVRICRAPPKPATRARRSG